MRGLRILACLTLAAGAALLLIPGANAAFENVEFTVVITDEQDNAGYIDIREVAFGEPGDNTLVARYKPQDFTAPVEGEFDIFMTTPAGAFRSYQTSGGDHSEEFSSCTTEGGYQYCVIPYDILGAGAGSALTGIYSISYIGAAQDAAPCPGGFAVCVAAQAGGVGGYGEDYTLTGCTKTGGCGQTNVPVAGTKTFYQNLTGSAVSISNTFTNTASSDTYVFNWTTTATSLNVAYNATVTNGTVAYTVKDSSGKTLASGTLTKTGSSAGPQTVPSKAGAVQITLKFNAFKGAIKLDVAPTPSKATGGSPNNPGGTGSPGGGNADTGTETVASVEIQDGTQVTEESPGVPLFGVVAMLAAMVLVARRRLA